MNYEIRGIELSENDLYDLQSWLSSDSYKRYLRILDVEEKKLTSEVLSPVTNINISVDYLRMMNDRKLGKIESITDIKSLKNEIDEIIIEIRESKSSIEG